MTGRRWVKALILVAGLALTLGIYYSFYLNPTLKKINHLKRDLRDLQLGKDDLNKQEVFFNPSDRREQEVLKSVQERFHRRIRQIKTNQQLKMLTDRIFQKVARLSQELNIKGISMDQDARWGKRVEESFLRENIPTLSSTPLASVPLKFTFSSPLDSSLDFVNQLPWGGPFVYAGKIEVIAGNPHPQYQMEMNLIFDQSQYIHKSKTPNPGTQNNWLFDPNSEILHQRVTSLPFQGVRKQEVQGPLGKLSFIDPGDEK